MCLPAHLPKGQSRYGNIVVNNPAEGAEQTEDQAGKCCRSAAGAGHLKSRRRQVDLPLPVAPTSAIVLPPGVAMLTPFRTGVPRLYSGHERAPDVWPTRTFACVAIAACIGNCTV